MMNNGTFILIIALLLIIVLIVYSLNFRKKNQVIRSSVQAEDRKKMSPDDDYLYWYKDTLIEVNENPEIERKMLDEIAKVYESHEISFDVDKYLNLVARSQELLDKKDKSSKKEFEGIQLLKKQMVENMPVIQPSKI